MSDWSRYDESDARVRPSRRGSRPRTKIRPAHEEAVDGTVIAVDRGRYTVQVDDAVVTVEPRGDDVRVTGSIAGADLDAGRAGTLSLGGPLRLGIPRGLSAYALEDATPGPLEGSNHHETPRS